MHSKFRHVALIGKYQAHPSGRASAMARQVLEGIAHFPDAQGCDVALRDRDRREPGHQRHYAMLDVGCHRRQCDLALVVGGDGTMLGIGRQLARHGVPLIGINQGRLGFITDISPTGTTETTLMPPMLAGQYGKTSALMHAQGAARRECVFDALAMNDVVLNRGATSGMVELRRSRSMAALWPTSAPDGLIIATPRARPPMRCPPGAHCCTRPFPAGCWCRSRRTRFVQPAHRAVRRQRGGHRTGGGRDASANFDMQSLASLLHGDRIIVRRSQFAPASCIPGLELLRHAAPEAALERGGWHGP